MNNGEWLAASLASAVKTVSDIQSTSDLVLCFCIEKLMQVWFEKNGTNCLCTEPHKPAWMHCPYRCFPCLSGGLFVGLSDDPPRSAILSESALQYYVQQYTKSGFRYTEKMGSKMGICVSVCVLMRTWFTKVGHVSPGTILTKLSFPSDFRRHSF